MAALCLVPADFKLEGKGALRDLQTLYWIGKYIHRVENAAALVDVGLLTPNEYRSLNIPSGGNSENTSSIAKLSNRSVLR